MRHLQKSGIITLKALGSPIGSRTAQVQEANKIRSKMESVNESVSHEAMGIASMTNTRKEAVQKFIDDNDLNAKEILKDVTKGKLPERVRFIQALVGTPNNSSFKWYVKNYANENVNEGVRISLVDPNTNKFIKTLSLDRTYREAEKEVETLNRRLSPSQKTKGLYWKVASIGESLNENKKAFKINPPIGSSKYSISAHNGVSKHKDGSPFYDILIFKNKADLERRANYFRGEKYVEESINEENPGLWANIRAKQARGEAPAPKNSKAYKDAVEAGDKIKNEQSIKREALKSIVKEVMQEEAEYQKFFQKVMDKAGKSIPSMSDEEKKAFFNKVDAAWKARGEKSESVVNEGQLNELGFLMTAAAAAVGIIGAGLLIKGVRFINQKLIDTAYSAAVQLQAKLAAKKAIQDKEQLEATIKPMISKFENDSKLKQMYSELPEYNRYPVSKPAIEGNKKRKEMLKKISIYITSKLTDDEKKYVNDISKYLRGGEKNESTIKEGIWPKSKLSGQFQMQLSLQLKKHFKGVFYSVGYDLYHNDKKILTIDGDDDSINSVVAKLKSKIR